jgi:hypothetical protein
MVYLTTAVYSQVSQLVALLNDTCFRTPIFLNVIDNSDALCFVWKISRVVENSAQKSKTVLVDIVRFLCFIHI